MNSISVKPYKILLPSVQLTNLWCLHGMGDEMFKQLYYNELYNTVKLNRGLLKQVKDLNFEPIEGSKPSETICSFLKENLRRIYTEIYTEGAYVV